MTPVSQIADDIPLPVMVFSDEPLELTWINLAGQAWLGSSLKSLSGKSLGSLFQDNETLFNVANKTLTNLAAINMHDLVVKPRGVDAEKCNVTTFLHEGQVGFCFYRLGRQTQKDNVFGDGASVLGRLLAHEIKNPLAGIQGAAQLLRDDVETEESLSLISLIESEIKRIQRLAERMERLGDVMSTDFTKINIHEILRHARKVIQSGISSNVKFTEHYDPSLPMTLGDEDSLTQAVLNLIKNAAEALEDSVSDPEITLETSYRASGGGLPIEIRVIDNGVGIPDHLRDNIFHPFITHKPQGQGLGLALVSKVVAAHGGLIEVQSREGETIFSILLPLAQRS